MIEQVHLRNFKCFRDLDLDLGRLTLLTGLNGMGKSSVIQSLLLLRQSLLDPYLTFRERNNLILNGELVRLGTARDVFYEGADNNEISIGLRTSRNSTSVVNTWVAEFDPSGDVLQARWVRELDEFGDPKDRERRRALQRPHTALLSPQGFQYLQAERIGPRIAYGMSDFVVRRQRQLGSQGEYTMHYLALFGDQKIGLIELAHPSAASLGLVSQVEAWMDTVGPGIRLRVNVAPDLDLVGLRYSFVTEKQESNAFRATNVGFGLSYTLPVLVAALAANHDSLLLIENPEAHLHPRGQSRIGELLARVAAAGAQVVIETHSDHVLNGVRLAVHGGRIPADQVRLHYFQRRAVEERTEHFVSSPQIDRDGRIDSWPEGFFDEWDRSLETLLEPRSE